MNGVEIIVALVIAVGLVGIVVPILPGSVLILAAIAVWAGETGGRSAWLIAAVCAVLLVGGMIVKYLIPGRQLKAAVPTRTLLLGALGALVGFFVIPVVGALVGFPVGVYLAERVRVGPEQAASSTFAALKAIGVSIAIEFAAAVAAIAVWLVGVTIT